MTCFECNLPDPYNGQGDGIGSCDCPRCKDCDWPASACNCDDRSYDDDYPDDDEPLDHSDRNPPVTVELPRGDVT